MQFLVLGYDGTDEQAVSRRMAARPAHLESVSRLRGNGQLISAAAILNDNEQMIGSMMVMEFPDRTALEQWLATEPYVKGDVWREIRVNSCKVAT